MTRKRKFLTLLKDYNQLRKKLKEKAWEITPNEIKKILCSKDGIYTEAEKDKALELLIEPHWKLGRQSPIESILDNRTSEVKKLFADILYSNPV